MIVLNVVWIFNFLIPFLFFYLFDITNIIFIEGFFFVGRFFCRCGWVVVWWCWVGQWCGWLVLRVCGVVFANLFFVGCDGADVLVVQPGYR